MSISDGLDSPSAQPAAAVEMAKLPDRSTPEKRLEGYKKTYTAAKWAAISAIVIAAILITIYVTPTTDAASMREWLNGRLFTPLYHTLGGTGGCAMISLALLMIVGRAGYLGYRYWREGIYVEERNPQDYDPKQEKTSIRENPKDAHADIEKPEKDKIGNVHNRRKFGHRVSEQKYALIALAFLVASIIVMACVFPTVGREMWNERIWPVLNNYAIAPIHNVLGDVGSWTLVTMISYVAAARLYRFAKYMKNGKYFAEVKINQDNTICYHDTDTLTLTSGSLLNLL